VEVRVRPDGASLHPVSDLKPLAALRRPLAISHAVRGHVMVAAMSIPAAQLTGLW
jgi:hypothetical protein